MDMQYDAIVVGTGQSGPSLAARMAGSGMRVAVVERNLFGGTCVNVGCTPTKSLVASARTAYVARRAGDFGVTVGGPVGIDMKKVKARKDAIVRASNQGVTRRMKTTPNITAYEGHARFEGPQHVRVNGDLLAAEKVFLNVGARAFVPDIPGIKDVPYLTNSSMLAVDFLPEHLIVVGGSYIGLEFAQIYRRFGARVTVIEVKERLIPREDDEISAAVKKFLEDEGVVVHVSAQCLSLERRGNGIAIKLDCGDGAREVVGSHLLFAVGRVPNTHDLGLDKAGVKTDPRGFIVVDEELRTNVPSIWALGDCNGRGAFTHTSYNDFEIVAANLLDGGRRRASDRIPAYALFTDPPLGRVGLTKREVRQSGRKALVARLDMEDIGRAYEESETRGFMEIVVDAETKRILGAAFLGIRGDEVVQSILNLMYADAPYTLIQRAVYIHPTINEFLPVLLDGLAPLE